MFMIHSGLKWVYLCIYVSIQLFPSSFNAFLSKCSDIYNYHTRNRCNFNQTRNKKKFADKTIKTTGPSTWNSINDNDNVKKAITANHFWKSFNWYLWNDLKLHVTVTLNVDLFSELVFVLRDFFSLLKLFFFLSVK